LRYCIKLAQPKWKEKETKSTSSGSNSLANVSDADAIVDKKTLNIGSPGAVVGDSGEEEEDELELPQLKNYDLNCLEEECREKNALLGANKWSPDLEKKWLRMEAEEREYAQSIILYFKMENLEKENLKNRILFSFTYAVSDPLTT